MGIPKLVKTKQGYTGQKKIAEALETISKIRKEDRHREGETTPARPAGGEAISFSASKEGIASLRSQ